MAALLLEDYVEGTEHVPEDMKTMLSTMRTLDLRVQNASESLSNKMKAFFAKAEKLTPEQRAQEFQDLSKEHQRIIEFSDEKIALASKGYDQIDRYIRMLDMELAKFAAELEAGSRGITATLDTKSLELDRVPRKIQQSSLLDTSRLEARPDSPIQKKRTYRKHESDIESVPSYASFEPMPMMVPVKLEDEPKYCICQQASFGEMICCDNERCAVEWFHYDCVGIFEAPKGKWFCPLCVEKMKKKKI